MVRIDFKRLRFLVIDDNAHMRRILRTLSHGFGTREVYEAEDGATSIEAFIHYTPDIVLTDWFMPIFDGLELAQMIRQPGANAKPYVPIIMLTGHSEKKRVLSARDAGITEFLAKPISAKALYGLRPRPGMTAGYAAADCGSSSKASATSSSQNKRASSRAASVAKRRNSVSSGATSPNASLPQPVSTRSTIRRLSRTVPPGSPTNPPSCMASIAALKAG
jgi:CheY-like chemotaxis protein